MGNYVTASEVTAELKLGSEWSTSDIDQLISEAESYVQNRTKNFLWHSTQTYTEYINGHNRKVIFLKHIPVTAISSVSVDDNNDGTYNSLTEGAQQDYITGSGGRLELVEDADVTGWPNYPQGVKVVYTAGYSTVPGMIKEVTILRIKDKLDPSEETKAQIEDLFVRLESLIPMGIGMPD